MAFNEIQAPRYNAILHKLLSMKEGAPAPILGSEILSALILENDRPEWAFLAGEHLAFGFGVQNAGGAGTTSFVGLQNPVNSGVLIILLGTNVVDTSANNSFDLRVSAAVEQPATPTTFDVAWRDLRGARGQGLEDQGIVGAIRGGATAAGTPAGGAGTIVYRTEAEARLKSDLGEPIILVPNSIVFWRNNASNAPCLANFTWRERVLEASEQR